MVCSLFRGVLLSPPFPPTLRSGRIAESPQVNRSLPYQDSPKKTHLQAATVRITRSASAQLPLFKGWPVENGLSGVSMSKKGNEVLIDKQYINAAKRRWMNTATSWHVVPLQCARSPSPSGVFLWEKAALSLHNLIIWQPCFLLFTSPVPRHEPQEMPRDVSSSCHYDIS